jgi:hypothetical protein
LQFPFFLMFGADVFNRGFGERVQHAVTGASANNKVVGKGNNILQVY